MNGYHVLAIIVLSLVFIIADLVYDYYKNVVKPIRDEQKAAEKAKEDTDIRAWTDCFDHKN